MDGRRRKSSRDAADVKSYRNLADPTTINGHSWSCLSDEESQPGQGAGSLILAWFRQHNS
jgi:hypothetical protein